ncbi:hypothetical protein [Arthrobacter sp. B0490]|uniref:hypothetical protein n=1 Tax=Arthrobacter sp. B0490 TaxID=2058891 RepID=UPI000CE4CCD3|nr:hypothetical protein [Arthrobacter sp. B0490]
MPFRSKQTLETWVDEFRTTREGGALVSVVVQDGADGADTGLVIVPLRSGSTEIFMQPVAVGDPRWSVSFGARSEDFELSAAELHGLAAELLIAASLCQFLQEKSVGHEERSAQQDHAADG